MFSRVRTVFARAVPKRNFSGHQLTEEDVKKLRPKNLATAGLLFGFVVGVYYYSISKMKNSDEFDKLIAEDKAKAEKA